MKFLKKHSLIALTYFLFIAFLGTLLRLFPVADIDINYRYIVHTHSHIALLGWVYTALTTLLFKLYLNHTHIEKKYIRLFWFTQITIVGMLLTFPFTGYALFSIIFSTLFLIASYYFSWILFKYTPVAIKQTNSYKCIHIALWYMIISSIGPWALGYIMNTAGSSSPLYKNAIYFYLHFQYNGWFIMALFGLFFYCLEQQNSIFSKKVFNTFFWLFNGGVIATFGISLLWMKPPAIIYIISLIGALIQLIALGILIMKLPSFWQERVMGKSKLAILLIKIVFVLFLIKLVAQFLGSTPYFATVTSSNIDFVIGYLHWIFLGVVSIALLGFLYHHKLIQLSKRSIMLYLIGFALTEGLIFYKGFVIWKKRPLIDHYFILLVIASCILLLAITNIVIIQFKKTKSNSNLNCGF